MILQDYWFIKMKQYIFKLIIVIIAKIYEDQLMFRLCVWARDNRCDGVAREPNRWSSQEAERAHSCVILCFWDTTHQTSFVLLRKKSLLKYLPRNLTASRFLKTSPDFQHFSFRFGIEWKDSNHLLKTRFHTFVSCDGVKGTATFNKLKVCIQLKRPALLEPPFTIIFIWETSTNH